MSTAQQRGCALPRLNDRFAFFYNLLTDPRRVSALAPSGRDLARLITSAIGPEDGPVIELGAGTGVFTRELIRNGVPLDKLALIEFGSDFARRLEWNFPEAKVLWMDATTLGSVELFGGQKAGAVVSGLPLLSMPRRKVVRILSGAFSHLREGGSFYQFTYGLSCPVPRVVLERFGLRAQFLGRAYANIPPAAVYRISRGRPSRRPF